MPSPFEIYVPTNAEALILYLAVEGYDAYLTKYSDGTQVVVNYEDEAITVGGKEIKARDWEEVTVG